MKVHGSCHCGQITYEAEVDPEKVSLCNCTDCQALTGTAFRVSVVTESGTFRFLTGQPRLYVKTAESGTKRRHSFCPTCGTPISAAPDVDNPPSISLRVGTLKERTQLQPKRQSWCRSALPWVTTIGALPGVPTQRT